VIRGGFLPALLATAIAVLPLMPAEHVHEAADRDIRTHTYAHRHGATHHAGGSKSPESTFEDHDEALTIVVAVAQPAPHYRPFVVLSAAPLPEPPELVETVLPVPFAQPIHGPPVRAAALRAPPDSSLL